ncbi:thiamine ABC transporter substrate binding subunit [Pasteurellaceae bacterium TAE3-ERU1]|nr:thiamine ABC transporter substrate binding subunit [Pasteurellaceae bacterium TAE3-ERU1]
MTIKKTIIATALFTALASTHALADSKPVLNVYSYDSFTSKWGPGPELKAAFEQKCGCEVNFVTFEDAVTMFNRLRLQGAKAKVDVVVGLDNNLLPEAENSNLFDSNNVKLDTLALPQKWDNHTFLPYDYGQYAFIYDKEKLQNPPKSLKELVDRQDVKIIYQDPRTSTVGRGLLAWMNSVYPKNEVAEAWKRLAKHTVTVGKGWSESYGAFLKGESDMVLSYNTSPLYHQINEGKDNYIAAPFAEGHIVQIELAAKTKSALHPKLADQFLAFLISPEAQKTIALKNVMLPVIKTSVNAQYDAFKPFASLPVPYPSDIQSKAQINVWQQALSQ